MKKSETLRQSYLRIARAITTTNSTPEQRLAAQPLLKRLDVAIADSMLSEAAQRAVRDIRILRIHTSHTNFQTTRSQNEILAVLSGQDLADTLRVLKGE